jgi:hypothetical protein
MYAINACIHVDTYKDICADRYYGHLMFVYYMIWLIQYFTKGSTALCADFGNIWNFATAAFNRVPEFGINTI